MYFAEFATVEGCYVATATTNSFLISRSEGLTCLDLRSAMHRTLPSEALTNERVHVDAQVGPLVANKHSVGDAHVHLRRCNRFCAIAEHNSAPCL